MKKAMTVTNKLKQVILTKHDMTEAFAAEIKLQRSMLEGILSNGIKNAELPYISASRI